MTKTITVREIAEEFGIGRAKWTKGVQEGFFPKPIEGFVRPKRWSRREVEKYLKVE